MKEVTIMRYLKQIVCSYMTKLPIIELLTNCIFILVMNHPAKQITVITKFFNIIFLLMVLTIIVLAIESFYPIG